jgi:microsomal dipeptidase-like Zn-dependent dipeptidase
LELVTDALMKGGYKSAAIEKILGRNFKRVLTEIWSA